MPDNYVSPQIVNELAALAALEARVETQDVLIQDLFDRLAVLEKRSSVNR